MDELRRRLVAKLAVALAIVSIFGAVILLLGFDISRRVEIARMRRLELTNRTQAISLLADLRRDYNEAQKYSSLLVNILPSRDQLFDFVKELEFLAKQQKVGFGFSFGSEQAPSDIKPGLASFSVTFQGSQQEFLNFLGQIEKMRFLVDFSGFDVTRVGDDLKVIMSGGVFFQ